jgi:hypothetical protein
MPEATTPRDTRASFHLGRVREAADGFVEEIGADQHDHQGIDEGHQDAGAVISEGLLVVP